jgi:hypothetical protein
MDSKSFNELPYEKQTKLENMSLRNVYLEFQIKEWENDNRAYLSFRPLYVEPSGGELRYYTDYRAVVQACGKHLFAALKFSCSLSRHGTNGFDAFYDDFFYSVNLERAKQMSTTLNWLERKIAEFASELLEHGYYKTCEEYITSVMFAMNAVGGIVLDANNQRTILDLEKFLAHISDVEQKLLTKYAKVEESETVNA